MTTREIEPELLITAHDEGRICLQQGGYFAQARPGSPPIACAVGTLGLLENLLGGAERLHSWELQEHLSAALVNDGFSPSYLAGLDDGFEEYDPGEPMTADLIYLPYAPYFSDEQPFSATEYAAGYRCGTQVIQTITTARRQRAADDDETG